MTVQVQRITTPNATREIVQFNSESAQEAIEKAEIERVNLARAQERAKKIRSK